MTSLGQHTHEEILSQPDAWREALEGVNSKAVILREFFRSGKYDTVIFTGCGSTYYLSLAVAALYRELTGTQAFGLPASEIWLYPQTAYSQKERTLLVALSRSGETTETLRACQSFKAAGHGDIVTLSCYPDRSLSRMGTLNLIFPSGQEQSVAQTRAFTTLYIACAAMIAVWAGRDEVLNQLSQLPQIGHTLLGSYQDIARQYGSDARLDRFYFLGSGVSYGLAAELSLKMKEMSLSHSEPFHFMEFRHGPQSMITPETLLIGLMSDSNRSYEQAVLNDMRKGNVKVLTFGEHATDVAFHSGLIEVSRYVLYLPIGQLLAFERACSKKLDPDRPNNLEHVVRLEQFDLEK